VRSAADAHNVRRDRGLHVERVTATIRDGDTVLVEGVDTWIESNRSPGGLGRWRGSFRVPDGVLLQAGGPFRLDATDGRSGQIIITNVEFGGGPAVFTGSGSFA
jgi:hypothetical protein